MTEALVVGGATVLVDATVVVDATVGIDGPSVIVGALVAGVAGWTAVAVGVGLLEDLPSAAPTPMATTRQLARKPKERLSTLIGFGTSGLATSSSGASRS